MKIRSFAYQSTEPLCYDLKLICGVVLDCIDSWSLQPYYFGAKFSTVG